MPPTVHLARDGSSASTGRRKPAVCGRGAASHVVQQRVVSTRGGSSKVQGHADSPLRRRVLFAVTYLVYASLYFARKPLSVLKPVLVEDVGFTRAALGAMDTALLAG